MLSGLKRIVAILVTISLFSFGIYAEETAVPSSWAQEEVALAIENAFVPEVLRTRYQDSIKRYEYVLLALELLERNGDYIEVINKKPFDDIDNHPYEKEIIKAYNAGVIKGYGDNTFRPNQNITRQEIASLVVNLVLRIEPNRSTLVHIPYEYSDESEIGAWATGYIAYCYHETIMKGIGKDANGLDIIDPSGTATIEQAILLLYRLADKESIVGKFDVGTIKIQGEAGQPVEASTVINQLSSRVGMSLAREILMLSADDIIVRNMSETYALVETISGTQLEIDLIGDVISIRTHLTDPNDSVAISVMNDLIDSQTANQQIDMDITSGISTLIQDINGYYSQEYESNMRLRVYGDQIEESTEPLIVTQYYNIIFEKDLFE